MDNDDAKFNEVAEEIFSGVELDDSDLAKVNQEDNDPEAEDTDAEDESTEQDTQADSEDEDENTDDEQTEDSDTDDTEASEDSEDEEPELTEEQKQAAAKREAYQRRQEAKQQREAQVQEAQREFVANDELEGSPEFRQLQVQVYNNTVESNINKLTNAYEKAVNDFPILSSDDPDIQAEVQSALDTFEATGVHIDEFGNPTVISGDFYQALQAKAESLERLSGIRAERQESSKAKEKSKTLPKASRTPKEPKKDPMLEAWDEAVAQGY